MNSSTATQSGLRGITEREQLEQALQENGARYHLLADAVPQIIWTAKPDGVLDYVNRRWSEYTGQTVEQALAGGWASALHPEDVQSTSQRWREALRLGQLYEIEYRFRVMDGTYRWFLDRGVPLKDAEGRVELWLGTCTDIDDKKRAQAQIEALNARLRRGIREIHHQVKNNLQIITALIDVQSAPGRETVPMETLKRLSHHVRGLAAIHELLTVETKMGGQVTFLSAQTILSTLLPILQEASGERRLRMEIEDFPLTISQGSSLTILINELVSNAVKHGKGDIDVSLTLNGDQAHIEVCDTGSGFAADFDPRSAAHTGLDLIESLSRWDLQGQVVYDNRPQGGGRVSVTFPLSTY